MKNRIRCQTKIYLIFFLLSLSIVAGTVYAAGNWWDKFGEPKYGGTITMRISSTGDLNLDNFAPPAIAGNWLLWFESLFSYDWKVDRNTWPFTTGFVPEKYIVGGLAESWEQPDPKTVIVHLRHGIHYQNKPPVNGRELTAEDVVFHYDRMCGTGHGYTYPNPIYTDFVKKFESATATDKYTVTIKFKHANATNFSALCGQGQANLIEAPEWVALGGPPSSTPPAAPKKGGPPSGPPKGGPPSLTSSGPLQDWHNAVGTGPWILTGFKDGVSLHYTRNPDYWGSDERHPQNKIPYADSLVVLCIPDPPTAYAALRTGKIDMLSGVDWKQTDSFIKGNPNLLFSQVPAYSQSILLNLGKTPFTDIKVRKALQMSLDLKTIAQSYYGGKVDPAPCGQISPLLKGYAYSYDQWPQTLKDEYSYNPEKAKQLLAQSGFPKGFDTNVIAPTIADLFLLQIMKSYFADIGVNMEIKTMDLGPYIAVVNKKQYEQMAAAGMETGSTGNPWESLAPSDASTVSDPVYLSMIKNFETITDSTKLAKQIMEADKYDIEKHWQVRIFPISVNTIWQPYIRGYSGETIGDTGTYARLWVAK